MILVGCILKFSLLNVSMNFRRNNAEKSQLCNSYDTVNVCMHFISLEVTGKIVVVVWRFFSCFFLI